MAEDFNPDAYLAQRGIGAPGSFDPDAYLAPPKPFDPDAYLGITKPQAAPQPQTAPSPTPVTQPTQQPTEPAAEGRPNPVVRGLVSGMTQMNPESMASFFEGAADLAPANFSSPLRSAGTALRDFSKNYTPEGYARTTDSMYNIKGLGDAFTWAGETFGQGIASTIPPLAGAGVGYVAGLLTPIPGGSAIGAAAGASIPSYMQNFGELRDDLIKEGVEPLKAAKFAAGGTIPVTALDVGSMSFILSRFGSAAAAKREIIHGLARRMAEEAGKGAVSEFSTEAMQQLIQDATVSAASGKPFLTAETAKSALESGVGGALVGPVAGIAGFRRGPGEVAAGRVTTGTQTPEEAMEILLGGAQLPELPPATPQPNTATPVDSIPEAVGGPPPPRVPEPKPYSVTGSVMPPNIVEAIQGAAPAPGPAPTAAPGAGVEDLMSQIRAQPGADIRRLAQLLGPKLYGDPSKMSEVSMKEMFQNSFDAIKGLMERGQLKQGKIDIVTDPFDEHAITMIDNGSGMTPDVLGKQFLQIAGTKKETTQASGGLGIAKMQFLFGSKSLQVTTMRNGKVAELSTSGESLFGALDDPSTAPQITIREPTPADRDLFPQGHGTAVHVTLPIQFKDTATGTMKDIFFPVSPQGFEVLTKSPLFHNISVNFNGEDLSMGSRFPAGDFTQFANVNFDWGRAKIYVSKAEVKHGYIDKNMHVLSNGLWQFSQNVSKDPSKPYGPKVQQTFYVDVEPRVSPEESGYPFDLNRQQFSAQTKESFDKIFNWISKIYQTQDLGASVENFGDMQYVDFDPKTKTVTNSGSFTLKPPTKPRPTPLVGLKAGDQITVKEGNLIVNGRKIPELSAEELMEWKPDIDAMKIPQSQISADRVILHDNTAVDPTGAPLTSDPSQRVSLTQLGVQKFGQRFYDYTFLIGNFFKQMRDEVATFPGYKDLKKEGVGISFDKKYYGVSIRIPFSASFVNPGTAALSTNQSTVAIDFVGTMVHELAHHAVRSHDADFASEMQNVATRLETSTKFNYQEFKQKVVRAVDAYWDIFQYLNGVYDEGRVEARGRRFETSERARGDVGAAESVGGPASATGRGSELSDWVALSETVGRERPQSGGGVSATPPGDSTFGAGANQRALDAEAGRGTPATQRRPETDAAYSSIKQATPNVAQSVKAAAAHADRFNWIYNWMGGILELRDANPRLFPLNDAVQIAGQMHNDEAKAQDAAVTIAKAWRKLGVQNENLQAFTMDMVQQAYRSPAEVAAGVRRMPTPQERAALEAKHKLSPQSVGVYNQMERYIKIMNRLVMQDAMAYAQRTIKDPQQLINQVTKIRNEVDKMEMSPFFPFTNFGRYYVRVVGPSGAQEHFQTFEWKGYPPQGARRQQKKMVQQLKRQFPNSTVTEGVLPESVTPFVGLSPTLTEHIGKMLKLRPDQLQALQMMQFQQSPTMNFRMRAQRVVPGYSRDFARSFSRYAFYTARYRSRIKYGPLLQDQVNLTRNVGGVKAGRIADYMQDWLDNTVMDAKGDYGIFKGAIFTWAMGYVPAAATQNLSQTPLITFPYLSGRFGSARSMLALSNSMRRLGNFYRKGSYNITNPQADFENWSLGYGIRTGRISETQAAELAALMNGGNLVYGAGGNQFQRSAAWLLEHSALFFETAEQFNRRVSWRAALDLAMQDNNNRAVNEAVQRHQMEYDKLVNIEKLSPMQARAVVTAIDTTERTQFVYSRVARPRFMRGSLPGTIFVFKRYIQSLMFLMFSGDRRHFLRYLLAAMLLGGMGGIPGYDDLKEIVKAAMRQAGYTFDPEEEVRRYVMMWFDGKVPPDMILHGMSRRGFGVPWLLDYLGSFFTGRPGRGFLLPGPGVNVGAPVLDRSKAITPGTLLPIEIGKLMQPQEDPNKQIADTAQKASGAVFSVGFNMYKTMFDNHHALSDPKRWERALPRELGAMTKAWRTFTEGRERSSRGGPASAPTMLKYDTRDTEQLSEIIAMGLGYNTLRQSQKWDRVMMTEDHIAFVKMQRQMLYEQMSEAVQGRHPQEIAATTAAIRRFNEGLAPEEKGMAIQSQQVMQSINARVKERAYRELELSTQKGQIPLRRSIRDLFPESVIDVQRR